MNFKSSSLALIAATVFAAPASAAVYTQEQVQMMVNSLEVTQTINTFDIPVDVLADCSDKDTQGGFYKGRNPRIEVCSDKMDDLVDVQQTVQHEAVHLAQWCRGSDSVYKVQSLKDLGKKYGDEQDFAHHMASKFYPESQYDSEFEAYYLMHDTQTNIVKLLNEECN